MYGDDVRFKRLDIIDKQVLDALKPLIFIQNVLLFPKFIVKDRKIMVVDRKTIKPFIGVTLFLLMRAYRFVFVTAPPDHIPHNIYALVVNFVLGCIGTIFTYTTSVTQSPNTVLMLLKLQQALRNINLEKDKILAHLKLWSCINLICVFVGYILYTGLILIVNQEPYKGGSFLVSYIVGIIFDVNVIFATRILDMTAKLLAAFTLFISRIVFNKGSVRDGSIEIIFPAYENIFSALILYEKVYQFAIFITTLQTFHQALYSVNLLIEFGKSTLKEDVKILGLLRGIVYFAWNFKNVLLLINLSVACGQIRVLIMKVETICLKALAVSTEQVLRQICKNVLRLNCVALRPLSAFGVFSVDAAFPLRIVGAVVPYIVVLLQFQFL